MMLQQYQHILVPVDGSYEAELAFKKAVAVAKRNGPNASVHMVHVLIPVLSKTFLVLIRPWLNK